MGSVKLCERSRKQIQIVLIPFCSSSLLNIFSDEEVAKYKRKMDEEFHKNRLLPGQEGYVYDVKVLTKKKIHRLFTP